MRFLPHTDADRSDMLAQMGMQSMQELFADIPENFHIEQGSLSLAKAKSEVDILRTFKAAANKNSDAQQNRCFLGAGTYHHAIPAAVDYIISRGEFLTAYTPYQPEISQGTLQALFEFQTIIARLLGMEVANASLYDAATAVAEAALMARRITRRKDVILAGNINPRYSKVCDNYLSYLDGDCHHVSDFEQLTSQLDKKISCVIIQNPDFYGRVQDLHTLREQCSQHGILLVVCFGDISAYGLIAPPGEYGADIAVGSGQSLGIPMGYGGPHLGLLSCKKKYLRQIPGRLCGMTQDNQGRRAFTLTLSTREQHIRREKATSNICTNQGLMCTAAASYMSLMGDAGLEQVAKRSAAALQRLTQGLPPHILADEGVHYNETVLHFPSQQERDDFLARAQQVNIFAGIPLERIKSTASKAALLVATTEMIEANDIDDYLQLLGGQ
ncbi:MAG: aminomethyl-transferring glycine dehydrogenase subunit GcvPA [Mariprofundaceae bacterium]|nr:aminomethyl-transferring glycine dehydrogenase subunit GcvPA [Mariprofundaceae bacterium]